jgi:hypothetical protein
MSAVKCEPHQNLASWEGASGQIKYHNRICSWEGGKQSNITIEFAVGKGQAVKSNITMEFAVGKGVSAASNASRKQDQAHPRWMAYKYFEGN